METKNNFSKSHRPSCIRQGVFLNKYSTFKVGGRADYFALVSSVDDLKEVIEFINDNKLDFFILGAGSNTLFSDNGFKGIVIKIDLKGVDMISESKTKVLLKVASGEDWDKFVVFCIENGFFGLENLTAIPGSVGGAIVQNIGAYGVDVDSKVHEVFVVDIKNDKTKKIKGKDLKFGYRDSIFKKKSFRKYVITEVVFELNKKSKTMLEYKDLKNYFINKKSKDIKHFDIHLALKNIRSNKFPDLKKNGTAGSFFKNVILSKKQAKKFLEKFPNTPNFETKGKIKISTGFILDKICGLRGYKEGDVGLFEKQSLVLVNFGKATSEDIFKFKEKIKKIVFKKTGIKIEEEVIII